ncbi:MAG: TolC family protein [Leptospirales bacterium]
MKRIYITTASLIALACTLSAHASAPGGDGDARESRATVETTTTGGETLRSLLLDVSAKHPRILERARDLASRLAAANYQSSRYPDPALGVAWSNYPYKKDLRLIDDQTPMTGVEISVSQAIPFPGRLGLETQIADVDASASRLRLAIQKNQIAREFLGALLEARSAAETAKLARGFAERIQIIAEIANTRYAVGKGDLTDVSKAGVSYAAFRDRVRTLEGALDSRYRALVYYLKDASDGDADDSPEYNFASPIPGRVASLVAPAVEANRNELSAYMLELGSKLRAEPMRVKHQSLRVALAALDIDRRGKEKTLAQMQYLPDFEVFASYRKRGDVANDPARGEDFMSFGFKMRVPLWSALGNHNNIEARDESRKSARFSERDLAEREQQLLDAARIDYQTLNERLKIYDESLVPRGRQSVEAARLAYETGRADFDAFLNSWETLYSLESERIRLGVDRDKQLLLMAFLLNSILPDHIPRSARSGVDQ